MARRVPGSIGQVSNRDVRRVLDYAVSIGFDPDSVVFHGSGHVRITHPNGFVTMPRTPGGGRWELNAMAELRRMARGDTPGKR